MRQLLTFSHTGCYVLGIDFPITPRLAVVIWFVRLCWHTSGVRWFHSRVRTFNIAKQRQNPAWYLTTKPIYGMTAFSWLLFWCFKPYIPARRAVGAVGSSPTKFSVLKTQPPSKGLGSPLAPLDFQTFLRPWLGMVWRVAGRRLSADQSYTTCSTQVKGFATFKEHFCRGHERDACCQASLVFRMTLPVLCFGGCPLEVCLSLMRMHFGGGYILLSLPAVKLGFFPGTCWHFYENLHFFFSVRDFCIMMVKKCIGFFLCKKSGKKVRKKWYRNPCIQIHIKQTLC